MSFYIKTKALNHSNKLFENCLVCWELSRFSWIRANLVSQPRINAWMNLKKHAIVKKGTIQLVTWRILSLVPCRFPHIYSHRFTPCAFSIFKIISFQICYLLLQINSHKSFRYFVFSHKHRTKLLNSMIGSLVTFFIAVANQVI